jgi:hypothetical protein
MDSASIRVHKPARNTQQRGFAGAVLSDHCVNLTRPALQAHIEQRLHRTELLGDALK